MADLGMPLQGGFLQRLSPNATKEEQTAVLNDIVDRLNDQTKTQVFSDGTSKRMLIGYQKDGWGKGNDFGIKVSLAGVDVTLAADSKLLFRMALDKWTWRNSAGTLVREFDIANGNTTDYDSSGNDFMQTGKLPDGSYGWATAKPGESVKNAFI